MFNYLAIIQIFIDSSFFGKRKFGIQINDHTNREIDQSMMEFAIKELCLEFKKFIHRDDFTEKALDKIPEFINNDNLYSFTSPLIAKINLSINSFVFGNEEFKIQVPECLSRKETQKKLEFAIEELCLKFKNFIHKDDLTEYDEFLIKNSDKLPSIVFDLCKENKVKI